MDRIIRVRSTKLDKEEESLKAIGRQKEAELIMSQARTMYETFIQRVNGRRNDEVMDSDKEGETV